MLEELHYATRMIDTFPLYEKIFTRNSVKRHHHNIEYLRSHVSGTMCNNGTEMDQSLIGRMKVGQSGYRNTSLDDNDIVDQILTFMIAGSETSANAAAFALYYLATHGEVYRTAYEEVRDVIGLETDLRTLKYTDLAKLRYLHSVINETLRLWPVAPAYFRQAKRGDPHRAEPV